MAIGQTHRSARTAKREPSESGSLGQVGKKIRLSAVLLASHTVLVGAFTSVYKLLSKGNDKNLAPITLNRKIAIEIL
jgi:hypothetical protein